MLCSVLFIKFTKQDENSCYAYSDLFLSCLPYTTYSICFSASRQGINLSLVSSSILMQLILFLIYADIKIHLIACTFLFSFSIFLLFLVMVFESSLGIRECLFNFCLGSGSHSNVTYFCCTFCITTFRVG